MRDVVTEISVRFFAVSTRDLLGSAQRRHQPGDRKAVTHDREVLDIEIRKVAGARSGYCVGLLSSVPPVLLVLLRLTFFVAVK